MMTLEKGPNRLNMKFTDWGRKVVIHLVGGSSTENKQRQKDNYPSLNVEDRVRDVSLGEDGFVSLERPPLFCCR